MADIVETINGAHCPECLALVIYSEYTEVCSNCGLVLNDTRKFISGGNSKVDTHFLPLNGNVFKTMFNPSECTTPENLRLFNRLRKQEDYTIENYIQPFYRSFLSHLVYYFKLSADMKKDIGYLFKKICRVYQIPSHKKIHVSLLVSCVYCVSSWKQYKTYISIKQLISFCYQTGHRMKLRYITNLMKQYPLLMQNYQPCSIKERVEYFKREVISTYLGNTDVKREFPNHFLNLSYGDYSEQLSKRYHIILKEIRPLIPNRTRNPLRLCCGVLYLSNLKVTQSNKLTRFLTQEKIGLVLNVNANYIRDGVVEVKDLLKH